MNALQFINNKFQGINPQFEGYVSSSESMNAARELRKEAISLVSENSLANRILTSPQRLLSSKQLWIISYAIFENDNYVKSIQF